MALTEKIENLEQLFNGHINGEIVKQVITRLTAPGENFLSLILKVDVTVKNTDGEELVKTVAKLVPPSHFTSELPFKDMAFITFSNEINWYEKIVPTFQAFEREYGLNGLTDIYPKYYGGRTSLAPEDKKIDKDATVVLEFLEDYQNGDRLVGFDFETSKDVLKALAKFHGVTMAFRHNKRKEFDEQILPHFNIRHTGGPPDDKFEDHVMVTLQQDPECAAFLPRVKEALKMDPFKNLSLEYREPWATNVHDDFWTNNMMLKKTPGVPKVKIVDFQMVLFKSFAVDLVFFLLTSVEDSVQLTRMDELMRYYYDELIAILKQFQVDTTQYKYDGYLKEIQFECRNGEFSHSMRFINIIYRDRGTIPDVIMEMDKDTFKNMMEGTQPRQIKKHRLVAKICAERNWI